MPTTQLYTLPEIKRNTIWYIEFHSIDHAGRRLPKSQQKLKCNLNRIKDLAVREIEAQKQLLIVKAKLGFHVQPVIDYSVTPILKALEAGIEIKVANVKSNNPKRVAKTYQIYADTMRLFKIFIKAKSLDSITIGAFTAVHATFFKDYLQAMINAKGQKYRPRTINNHTGYMLSLFNELQQRDYVKSNPFSKIKKVAEGDPLQRAFEPWERDLVLPHIFKDQTLTLAVMLIYRTAIRPVELLTLRPKFFDFDRGLIRIPGTDTKAKESAQFITIPDDILPFFKKIIGDIDKNWFIFGEKLKPHPTIAAGEKSLTRRHRDLMKSLLAEGVLTEINGLFFYSWKDTLALDSIKAGWDIYDLMKHFRHKDISTTQKYFKKAGIVNEAAKKSKMVILPI